MMRPLLSKTSTVLCLAFSSLLFNAHAQEAPELKYYDVEIIIFKNLNVSKRSEKTQPFQAPEFPEQYIDLSDPENIEQAQNLGFSMLLNDELRLSDTVNSISFSSRYKLLAHTAWRQPGLALNKAIPVKITAGDTFNSNYYSSIDEAVNPVVGHPNSTNQAIKSTVQNNNDSNAKVWYELEGKITISLARYLHTHVDLVLRVPNDNTLEINAITQTQDIDPSITSQEQVIEEFNITSSSLINYSLKEKRRMRSKRLHYLDHPEMGMLVLITPYEAPEETMDSALEISDTASTPELSVADAKQNTQQIP